MTSRNGVFTLAGSGLRLVPKDVCFDRDEGVQRVLTGKLFPAQATVITVDAFIGFPRGKKG